MGVHGLTRLVNLLPCSRSSSETGTGQRVEATHSSGTGGKFSIISCNAEGSLKLRDALTGAMPSDVWIGDVNGHEPHEVSTFFWTDLNDEAQSDLIGLDWVSLSENLQDVSFIDGDGDGLLTSADLAGVDTLPHTSGLPVVIVGDWDQDEKLEMRLLP